MNITKEAIESRMNKTGASYNAAIIAIKLGADPTGKTLTKM